MGVEATNRTTGQSRGVDALLAYYRRLLDADLPVAQPKPAVQEAAKPKVDGWSAHEQMLEAVGQQDAGTAQNRKRFTAGGRTLESAERAIQGAPHLAIPAAPLGRGARQNRQAGDAVNETKTQKAQKLGTSTVVPHRPMGAQHAGGAVIIA